MFSLALQPDGKVLAGGNFTTLGGQVRHSVARLNADGSLDASFNPDSDSTVHSLAVQPDGKVLAGGQFASIGGQTRNHIARLSASEAAVQSLQSIATGDGLRWMRSGAGPEVSQVRFAMSTVEDAPEASWTDLGAATRVAGGWALDGVSFPAGDPVWVRAQGFATGGYLTGSSSLVKSVRMLYFPLAAPHAPTGLTAAAGSGAVTLSWTAPANNGGSAILSYAVTGTPAGGGATVSCPATAPSTSCTVSGLTNGVAYTFNVTATNATGTSSPSASTIATPQAGVPGAPPGLTAVAGGGAVTLSWSAPVSDGGSPILSYTVTGTPAGGGASVGCPAAAPATTCTVSGLANGVTYTFTVAATNSAGTGSPSASTSATPQVWSQSGLTLPGGGSAGIQVSAPPGCSVSGAQFTAPVLPGAPTGAKFPLGVFSFSATGCANATLSVRIDYPSGSLSGLLPYKYGPQTSGAASTWFPYGTVSGDSVTYSVTDNGVGDSNPALGAIDDPFAPVLLPSAPGGAAPIPTLREWALIVLSLLTAMVGIIGAAGLRRRAQISAG